MQRPWGQDAVYRLAPCSLLILLSYNTQDYQPREGTTHSELIPLTPIINQENLPQACSQVNR